jgi:hypothetical protein
MDFYFTTCNNYKISFSSESIFQIKGKPQQIQDIEDETGAEITFTQADFEKALEGYLKTNCQSLLPRGQSEDMYVNVVNANMALIHDVFQVTVKGVEYTFDINMFSNTGETTEFNFDAGTKVSTAKTVVTTYMNVTTADGTNLYEEVQFVVSYFLKVV